MSRVGVPLKILRFEDKYGPRVALKFPFDTSASNALKHEMPWPRTQFDGEKKMWTVDDDIETIKKAVDVLQEHGYDFTHLLLSDGVEQPRGYVKARGTGAEIRGRQVELRWDFVRDVDVRARLLEVIKSIAGRRFDPQRKTWLIPVAQGHNIVKELAGASEEFPNGNGGVFRILEKEVRALPEINEWLEDAMKRVELSQAVDLEGSELMEDLDARLDATFPEHLSLYPFQRVGVAFIELADGRCIIGDDMGVGKTIQAIGYMGLHIDRWPALVVCPANVKYNWQKEINKWLPSASVEVIKTGKDEVPDSDFVIINYDLMSKQMDALIRRGFNTIVCDESHYLKNKDAKRTQATLRVAADADAVLCLSGTAITSRPKEFFTTLNLIAPEQFPSFMRFARRYCDAWHNGYGWDFNGSSNEAELNDRIRDFCIRRLKSEVLTELPDKTRTMFPVYLDDKAARIYAQTRLNWIGEYESRLDRNQPVDSGFVLQMLTEMRHQCGILKIPHALQWIDEYVSTTGKPLVVFTHHKDVVKEIFSTLRKSWRTAVITGDVAPIDRANIVDSFQAGELDVLVATTKATKEGITLTRADTTLFIEREWVPAWEEQAEDRVYRIGQESNAVQAVYLSAMGTVDEHFDEVVEEKRKVVKAVLDGGTVDERKGIVKDLLKRMQDYDGFPGGD